MLKPGMLIFADCDQYFSFVVSATQISKPTDYDDVVVSWTISPNVFRRLSLGKTTHHNIKNFIPASCTLYRIT